MGKYMKKGKITDVAVMEIPPPGVRTRARTLALNNNDLSFLQLRGRRLLKPPFLNSNNTPHNNNNNNNTPRAGSKPSRVDPVRDGGGPVSQGRFGHFDGGDITTTTVEDSCGENNLERSTRESTPCSLIRDSETIGMPGSTTRPTCSTAADRRARTTQRTIPTSQELEEFFAEFHRDEQKRFMEKYNFDIINDVPLPGRYEWEKIE